MPDRTKKSARSRLISSLRVGGLLLLLLEHDRERRAGLPDAEGLDLDLPLRRATSGCRSWSGSWPAPAWSGSPSRAPVTGSSTMVQPTCACFAFAAAASSGALLRVEHAGFLELAVALERLDRGGRLVVELAVDQAVVVAGPGQVELDGDALGERDRRAVAARRRRRVRFFGLGLGHADGCRADWRFVLGGGGQRGEQESENGTHDPHGTPWSARLDG